MATNPRLRFALERLTSGEWLSFERFAAEFLVSEFPTLRTTANPSGDGGRDGEVFILSKDPRTAMQYSVTKGWAQKIRDTVKTLSLNHPSVRRIVYCTSQEIGSKKDKLCTDIWNETGVQVDVRDASWFIDRESESPARAAASAELASTIVDPYLQSRDLNTSIATPLTRQDSKVALLQLSFRSQDDDSQRGLTRTTFEALVIAALHASTAESTVPLESIIDTVRKTVPRGAPGQVRALVESALKRLCVKSGPVTRRSDTGEYHISFKAAAEWKDSTVEYLLNQEGLEADLAAAAFGLSATLDADFELLKKEAELLRGALEAVLLQSGERFVEAIESGDIEQLSEPQLADDIGSLDLPLKLSSSQAAAAILRVLSEPSEQTTTHLSRVLEAYTLFAFLQATPDVQKSLSRIFAGGQIWLDASAVLPLLGELLISELPDRSYTSMLRSALDSGVKLYITDGMVEEVERHLNLCLTLAGLPHNEWRSRVPFVYAAFVLSGRAESELPAWIAEIRGDVFPQEDVAVFLETIFGIKLKSLSDHAASADVSLRGAVKELWMESHEARRAKGLYGLDPGTVSRLVEHDVENVVGVMQLRRSTPLSPLGHTSWWLTLDSTAFKLPRFLSDQLGHEAPPSPIISPDFLAQMLRFGPLRREVEGDRLPLVTDISRIESVPRELIELAESVRSQYSDYSELRIRREVRDALERARSEISAKDRAFGHDVQERVKSDISSEASQSSPS